MKGTIVAINRQLGALVVETLAHKCMVLETLSRVNAEVGDEIEGDWSEVGSTRINNLTKGTQMQIVLQTIGVSRNEAVGRMTVL